ncbi:hypothetical protein AX14_013802 [Amanita brunnescens Koide BX004]|nr:hypothetical protein AX14_000870 [Amanita brunnescens Koide BX004]KAF8706312.1 hypothetical protein AX14_013802 [Amanita brunnescens Koide BX004]
MRMASAVCEDAEQEILLPFSTQTGRQQFPSQNRCPTHLSPLQPPSLTLPQPSLPLMCGSTQLSLPSRQTLEPDLLPHTRSQSTVSLLQPASGLTYKQTVKSRLSPDFEQYTPIPVTMENADLTLERQKLNALVIASGLGNNDKVRTNGPANNSSPSRVYLEVKSSQDEDTKNYVAPIMPQKQFVVNCCPSRSSTYLQDEFADSEDASYFVKEMNTLLLPYYHPSKDVSPVSKWSLSSSVKVDLVNKRSSPSKYLKSKAVKFWSFISRFSSNSQSNSSDKHALFSAVDVQEKSIRRQYSHSDLVESVAGCSSSVSTPTTALSMARISSSNYSAATPNNHEVNSDDQVSSGRCSSDKLATKTSISSIKSSVPRTIDPSSNLTCSEKTPQL